MKPIDIGIIGGSGLYELFPRAENRAIETPYGQPSAAIQISSRRGRKVAFLPRHGRNHEFAPHLVNYRANIYAMKSLGVKVILGLSCSGSLIPEIKPGDVVICNDFIDYTSGRAVTFVQPGEFICLGMHEVYPVSLRTCLQHAATKAGIAVHNGGTTAVINGPRLSTRAESRRYAQQGCHIVNMTQYPECYLARELGVDYASLTLITDYDAGVANTKPIALQNMVECFDSNLWKLKTIVAAFLDEHDMAVDHNFLQQHRASIVNGNFFGTQVHNEKR